MWNNFAAIYLINDEYIEYRKALAEGKEVEYKFGKYEDSRPYYIAETGTFKMPIKSYRDKPENKPFWGAENGKIAWEDCSIFGISRFLNKYLAYKTKELAKAKWRVQKRIYELNNNEKVNFRSGTDNWSFDLDSTTKGLKPSNLVFCKIYPTWQYLKSKELVKQLLEEMYDDCMLIRSE